MSQPPAEFQASGQPVRRSARFRGVPVVDLTEVVDVMCCVCGFADGTLIGTPCCQSLVHCDCMEGVHFVCPSCASFLRTVRG